MARRDTTDPDSTGAYLKWAFSWPANRRILYNRASANLEGKAWDPKRKLIEWDGTKWSGYDVPDIAPTAKPDQVGPFIMNPEGVGRLLAKGMMKDGPFPSHYEPFESPVANLVAPKIRGNPVARVFKSDLESARHGRRVPLCRNQLPGGGAFPLLVEARPDQCRPSAGILRGDFRGTCQGKGHRKRRLGARLVQARLDQGQGPGNEAHQAASGRWQAVHVVGIPLNWGFTGGEERLRPEFADLRHRRREYRDAGIQGVSSEYRTHQPACGIREDDNDNIPASRRHPRLRHAGQARLPSQTGTSRL